MVKCREAYGVSFAADMHASHASGLFKTDFLLNNIFFMIGE